MKKAALLLLVLSLVSCVVLAVGSYLDRPVMTIDENGDCKSARGPQGPIACADIKEEDWGNYDTEKAYKPLPKK